VRIRLALTDDLDSLRELVAKASEELHETFDTPRMDDLIMVGITHGIRSGEAVVVAEQMGEIIGYCAWVHLPGLPPGVVEGLGTYVLPMARKDYVSHDMRVYATDHARRMGYQYVRGEVALNNEAGLKSALANGFEISGYVIRKELGGSR
jgi:hypothetical protein